MHPSAAPAATAALTLQDIVFRPDLLIRWDDETVAYAYVSCLRPDAIAARPVRRSSRH